MLYRRNVIYSAAAYLSYLHGIKANVILTRGRKCLSMLPGEDERVGRLPNTLVVKEKQRLAMLVVSKARRQILSCSKSHLFQAISGGISKYR